MNGKTNGSNFNCQLFYNKANVCIFITINCIAMAAAQKQYQQWQQQQQQQYQQY